MPKVDPDIGGLSFDLQTSKEKSAAKSAKEAKEKKTNGSKKTEKKKKGKKTKVVIKEREIQYPKYAFKPYVAESAMDLEEAKKILGWEEETETTKIDDYHFQSWSDGTKVICHNNLNNRPFDATLSRTYMSDILHKRFYFNGETIIITQKACIGSGLHRLVGFVWAVQEWLKNKERWPLWEEEPTLECLVVFGISDEDYVINTIDSGRVRTLADTLYRSEVFKGKTETTKKRCAKMLENAIKWLYYRTGSSPEALAPGKTTKRTLGESHDFLQRHLKLVECVNHIYDEDTDENGKPGKIKKYMPVGYAAAYLYMMGCSASNPKEYRETDDRNEDMLDWSNEDMAFQFWADLAGGVKTFGPMRQALGDLLKENLCNVWTQSALMCKAWARYVAKESLTAGDLKIAWEIDEETEAKRIAETPTVGGIDLGKPEEEVHVSKEEIEKSKAVIKMENMNGKLKPIVSKQTTDAKLGDKVHVADNQSDSWDGELIDVVANTAKVKDTDGKIYEIEVQYVRRVVGKPTGKDKTKQPVKTK